MKKENWAESLSNNEKLVFNKGNWSLMEDGEGAWSLYYNDVFVDTALDFNVYKLFEKGFLLYNKYDSYPSFALYAEEEKKPIFKMSGQGSKMKYENNIITFYNSDSSFSFDTTSLIESCDIDCSAN